MTSQLRVGPIRNAASRAVRLFLGGDRGQLDHQVRFHHDLRAAGSAGSSRVRREALEELLRGEDHLVGRLAPAALAAHAVGQHRKSAAGDARVGDDLHLVLLVGAVAAVHAGGGGSR